MSLLPLFGLYCMMQTVLSDGSHVLENTSRYSRPLMPTMLTNAPTVSLLPNETVVQDSTTDGDAEKEGETPTQRDSHEVISIFDVSSGY